MCPAVDVEKLSSNVKRMQLNRGLRFLNDYSVSVICRLFSSIGILSQNSTSFSVEEEIVTRGFSEKTAKQPLEFMCEWLFSEGILKKSVTEDGVVRFIPVATAAHPDLEELDKHMAAKFFPAGPKLLRLTLDCAEAIFRSSRPEVGLYATDTVALWKSYFSHPGMQLPAQLGAQYIFEHLQFADKPIRILEVGAGSASGTRALYELLNAHSALDRIEYFCVSDVTESFVEGSRSILEEMFGADRLFQYRTLDLNCSIEERGIAPKSIDVILGINCFHYIRDWNSQLRELLSLLVPGGLLVSAGYMRKSMDKPFHIELLGCLFKEYWDIMKIPVIRPGFGIMPPLSFYQVLAQNGFVETELWPEPKFWDTEIPLDFYCGVVAGKREC